MAIVAGVNIPDNKRVEISLRTIFGIGGAQAKDVVAKAGIEGNPRVKDLTETDLTRIREIVDREKKVEGDLRREVNMNIRRLIDIGSYRGFRHRRRSSHCRCCGRPITTIVSSGRRCGLSTKASIVTAVASRSTS